MTPCPAHSIPPLLACAEPREVGRALLRLPVTLLHLCFQQLPTIKSCNPFVLLTMQIAPGVLGHSRRSDLKKYFNWGSTSVSPLECALTSPAQLIENTATLSHLECAVTKNRALTPLECAVTKKGGGGTGSPNGCQMSLQNPTFLSFYFFTSLLLPPARYWSTADCVQETGREARLASFFSSTYN